MVLQEIANAQDVMLLASRHGRGGGCTSQLVAANRVHVFFNDHPRLLKRLDQCVAGSCVRVASRFWTSDCPALVGALEHAGLILSLRASAVYGVPEIHRPCEVQEEKLTRIAQNFLRHCFLRLSSVHMDEGSAPVAQWAEDQMVERLAALFIAQDRVWQLAAALGYTGKSEDLMQCAQRLLVTSVSKVTRPLKLRVCGELEAKGSDTQTRETPEANAQLGDGRGASSRGARRDVCFACGEVTATCTCLDLEDHLEWAVEWGAAVSGDGKRDAKSGHAAMPVTISLSRAAVLGELGERGRAVYDDLAPLQLQGLDLLVTALTSILSADGNPFLDADSEQSHTEGMSGSAGAGRFGGGFHEIHHKSAPESISRTGAAGKSGAVEAEASQENVQGQDGAEETQTSLLAQLVREMMSLGEEDLSDTSPSSSAPGAHAVSASTTAATAATPMPPPASVEPAPRADMSDAGLQRQEEGTVRDGVWDRDSSLQQAGSEGANSARTAGSAASKDKAVATKEAVDRPGSASSGPSADEVKRGESWNRVEGPGLGARHAREVGSDGDVGVQNTPASALQVRRVRCRERCVFVLLRCVLRSVLPNAKPTLS